MKTVGILALQGDFDAHRKALKQAGAHSILVRRADQFHEIDGLIIPGGESTTMLNLLYRENLYEPLRAFGAKMPVFGTCAGVILMCTRVQNPPQESLGLLDLAVERNGYGRQIDSSIRRIEPSSEFTSRTSPGSLEAVFIRAPVIQDTGSGVTVLAEYRGKPVLVEQNGHLGATFHPELAGDWRVHQLFLSKL